MRRRYRSSVLPMWGVAAISVFALIVVVATSSATEITIESTYHCCLNSAYTLSVAPGEALFTYVSGAWTNHYNHVNWLGYVRIQIPSLGLDLDIGTEGMIPYSSYELAEQAAMGDTVAFVNDTGEPVVAYFFVDDSCPQGGYCHDNWGAVVIWYSNAAPVKDGTWSTIKALYR